MTQEERSRIISIEVFIALMVLVSLVAVAHNWGWVS